jgi:hypothetical protein
MPLPVDSTEYDFVVTEDRTAALARLDALEARAQALDASADALLDARVQALEALMPSPSPADSADALRLTLTFIRALDTRVRALDARVERHRTQLDAATLALQYRCAETETLLTIVVSGLAIMALVKGVQAIVHM